MDSGQGSRNGAPPGGNGRSPDPFGNNPFTNQLPPTIAGAFAAPPSANAFGPQPGTHVHGSPSPAGPPGSAPSGPFGQGSPGASAPGFGGAVASPLEGSASRSTGFLLQTANTVPLLPRVCACCTSPAQLDVRVARSRKTGRYTSETRVVRVPYCTRCKAHLDTTQRRNLMLGLAATVAGGLSPLLLATAWTYAPAALIITAGSLVSLALCAFLGGLWKEPAVAREAGCCANHQAFDIQSFAGPIVNLRLFNARFAQQVAQMNHTNALPVMVRAPLSARWIVPPIMALAAAIPTYFLTHGLVHFDNPSQVPLTFVVDDGEEALTIAPGDHARVHLPIGERDIAVQMSGVNVDRFTGDVDPATDHVATPLGTSCYATQEAAYGSAVSFGRNSLQIQSGLRWYSLADVDYVLAPFPGTVQLGRGQRGAIKRRFARVDCMTGRAVH